MAALQNHKHELFAQALAKGETADAAYVSAGYRANRGNAATLKANQNVEQRVAELQERAAIKVDLTITDIVQMLNEDRALARQCEQSGSAVSATLGMAKVLGFLRDKVELTGKDGGPVEHTVEQRADEIYNDVFGPTLHLIQHDG